MNPHRIKKNNELMTPGVCFICESARDVPFVDMERNHDPEGFVVLRGRKYLCEICVKDAVEALGLQIEDTEKTRNLEDEILGLIGERESLAKDLADSEASKLVVVDANAVIEGVGQRLESAFEKVAASFPKPRAKKSEPSVGLYGGGDK